MKDVEAAPDGDKSGSKDVKQEEDKQKGDKPKEMTKEESKEKMPEMPVLQLHGKLSSSGERN